jgi:hypothetical protein
MPKVIIPLVRDGAIVVYPDDISMFTSVEIVTYQDKRYLICNYAGTKTLACDITLADYLQSQVVATQEQTTE